MAQIHTRAHERILEIVFTCDESDDSVIVTAINYYRDRSKITDALPRSIGFTAEAAAGTHECWLGEIVPPPQVLRLKSTFQA